LQDIIKGWYDFEAAIGKFYARIAQLGKVNFVSTILLQFTSLATAFKTIFGVIKASALLHAKTTQSEMTTDLAN